MCTSREELNPAHLSQLIYGSLSPGKVGGIFFPFSFPPRRHTVPGLLCSGLLPWEHHSLSPAHSHPCPAPQNPSRVQ